MTVRVLSSSSRGFTLVELIVVLVLLSLVTLTLASVMRTAAQTEERVDARLERIDDLRIASDFIRAVLGRVSAQKRVGILEPGGSQYYFVGAASEVQWVGVMPARYGAGGRYHFRLGVADGGVLTLQFVPWTDASTPPDWSVAQNATLLSGVTGLALRYEDAAVEPPDWSPQWTLIDRLPNRVAISVQTATGPWPDIIIPLRILPGSDPRSSGPVFGGSS